MGLSAGMWGSVSGLLMHGEKMNVVGNNIANISTIGFKGQRMDFEDYIYQDSYSAGGPTQIGRGVGINAVMGDFSQASFEMTNDQADLAIGGKGFFQVRDPYSSQTWYTRAGNFRFDKEGTMRNPQGFALQGWQIQDNDSPTIGTGATGGTSNKSPLRGSGVPTDVRFNSWTVDPKQTTKMELGVQLPSKPDFDKFKDSKNPMFSLFGSWNGKQPPATPTTPPIGEGAYPATMTIFDEAGTPHTITTYFDQVSGAKNLQNGNTLYEYMVTMPPADDKRTYGGKYNPVTGLMEDDMTTYTGALGTVGSKIPAGSLSLPANLTMQNAIDQINDARARATGATPPVTLPPLTAEQIADLQVKQYPSGGWYVDPNDPILKETAAHAAVTGNAGDIANLTAMSTGPTGVPADPRDANTVKKMSESKSAGILMMGTIEFDSSGNIVSQSAFSYKGSTILQDDQVPNANPDDLSSWEPTPVSNNGLPMFTPNFSGQPLANTVHQKASPDSKNQKDAERYLIEFDLGFKSVILDNPWTAGGSAADIGTDYNSIPSMKDGEKSGTGTVVREASGATNVANQNGYTFGSLSSYIVDKEGILSGIYSNGVTKPLYQIALYDFVNTQGLRREGGNLFSSTMDSGNPRLSVAGQNGMGTVNSMQIEQSNVDMSREFVQMISTQRGFQANSKGITTIDGMLETVIGMKR